MEIHSTIQFRLILPHIPGFQQMPLPTPVCSHSLECNGCPYPRHGEAHIGGHVDADGAGSGLGDCQRLSLENHKKRPSNGGRFIGVKRLFTPMSKFSELYKSSEN